jgi:hypothetical protein
MNCQAVQFRRALAADRPRRGFLMAAPDCIVFCFCRSYVKKLMV